MRKGKGLKSLAGSRRGLSLASKNHCFCRSREFPSIIWLVKQILSNRFNMILIPCKGFLILLGVLQLETLKATSSEVSTPS